MRRLLFIVVSMAVLLMPVVSMAGGNGGAGVGVVPSITIQANSVHYNSFTNGTSVMQTQTFTLKQGVLQFNVAPNQDGDDTAGMTIGGQISFTGSASYTAAGKTTTISNVFMNMSGLLLNAKATKAAAISDGTISGTLDVTDPDGTQTKSFKGAYNMKVALTGWVPDGGGGTRPTSGTISSMSVVLKAVGTEDNSTVPPTFTPEPVVVFVTVPPIPFKIFDAGDGGGAGPLSGTWNAAFAANNLTCGGTATFNLTQTGNTITGIKYDNQDNPCSDPTVRLVTGTVAGSTVTMQFTSGGGTAIIITATLNADKTLSGTVKNSAGIVMAKWGAAPSTGLPGGVSGSWTRNCISNKGHDPGTGTLNMMQYGSTIMGTDSKTGGPVTGTIIGTAITLSTLDEVGGAVKFTGTVNKTATPPISGTYTDTRSALLYDSGTWTATMDAAPSATLTGNWNLVHVSTDLSNVDMGPLVLTQDGAGGLTGTVTDSSGTSSISGTVSGNVVALTATSMSDSNITTIAGFVNADGTLSGTYTRPDLSTGQWGAALSGSTPGITGNWSVTHTSTMGHGSGMSTFSLGQFGSTVLGVNYSEGGGSTTAIAGTLSGAAIVLNFPDGDGGTIKASGTLNMTLVPPVSGTYTDKSGATTVDAGSWRATKM